MLRKPTSYGVEALKIDFTTTCENHFTIISGLAEGIDAAAHNITLNEGGQTIGVLGGGLLIYIQKVICQLAEEYDESRLLVSETPPTRRAEPWMFPMRNRIISGLSKALFVVEARKEVVHLSQHKQPSNKEGMFLRYLEV